MLVRANNSVVELFCEHCREVEPVKDGLPPASFLRGFNAFRSRHDVCGGVARPAAVAVGTHQQTATPSLRVTGADIPEAIKGTRADPFYEQAREVVLAQQRASISLLQLKLRIGYNHAARLLEALEGDVLGPMGAGGVRPLLV